MGTKYLYMFFVKGVSSILLLLSSVLVARVIDIDQFGTFSFVFSFVTVFSFAAIWGTDRYCLKEISLVPRRFSENSRVIVLGAYSVVLINTVLLSIAIWWFLPGHVQIDGKWTAVCAILLLLFRSLLRLSTSIMKGLNRVILSEVLLNSARPLLLIFLLVIFAVFLPEKTSVANVILLFAASFAVLFVVSNLFVINTIGFKAKITSSAFSSTYRCAFAFFIVGAGTPLLAEVNTIELGLHGTSEQVALFSAAKRIASVVLMGLVSANLLISPKIAPLFKEKKTSQLIALIRSNNLFVLLITSFPVALLLVFSEQAMGLFGEEYIQSAVYLKILLIGQVVNVLCGPVLLVATLTGLQKWVSVIVLFSCAVSFILCEILIPRYGAFGAVYSAIAGTVCVNISLVLLIYIKHGINISMFNLLHKNIHE